MNMIKKKGKVQGSVLLTVISVLMVMIVMLLGTLALASSANKRSHSNYSSAQVRATAQSGIESVVLSMMENADVAKLVYNMDETSSVLEPEVVLGDSALGEIVGITVEYVTQQWIWDDTATPADWAAKNVIKISAVAELNGNTCTTSAYLLADPPLAATYTPGAPITITNSPGAMVTLGSAVTANGGGAAGGSSFGLAERITESFWITNGAIYDMPMTLNAADVHFAAANVVYQFTSADKGIAVFGNCTFENTLKASGSNGSSFEYSYTLVDEDPSTTDKTDISNKQMPYLFVEGRLSFISGENYVGDENHPMNVFCGSLTATSGSLNAYGDVYCMDPNETTYFGSSGYGSRLYTWASNLIAHKETEQYYKGSSLYSMGNVELTTRENYNIGGSVRVEQNLTVTKGGASTQLIGGDVVVGGTLTLGDGVNLSLTNGKVYCDNIVGNGTINGASVADATLLGDVLPLSDFLGSIGAATTDADGNYVLTTGYDTLANYSGVIYPATMLKEAVLGQQTYTMVLKNADGSMSALACASDLTKAQTSEKLVSPVEDYLALAGYLDETTTDANGDGVIAGEWIPGASYITEIPAAFTADVEANLIEWGKVNGNSVFDTTFAKGTGDNDQIIIKGSCTLSGAFGNHSILIEPDVANPVIWIKLTNGFEVSSGRNIIINDTNSQVNFYIDDNTTFKMAGGDILTKYYSDLRTSGKALYMTSQGAYKYADVAAGETADANGLLLDESGNHVIDTTSIPNVHIYSGTNANMKMANDYIVTAFVSAPNLTYWACNGTTTSNLGSGGYYYDGTYYNKPIGMIGGLSVGAVSGIQNQWMSLSIAGTTTTIPGTPTWTYENNNYIQCTDPATGITYNWELLYYENY